MTTADDLPDDVMERTAEAFNGALDGGVTDGEAEALIAALLDADPPIVALVTDPDADAAAGWTVARLTDVQRREPCDECDGTGEDFAVIDHDGRQSYPCPSCGGEGTTGLGRIGTGPVGECRTCGGSGKPPAVTDAEVEAAMDVLEVRVDGVRAPHRMRAALRAAAQARAAWDARLAGGAS